MQKKLKPGSFLNHKKFPEKKAFEAMWSKLPPKTIKNITNAENRSCTMKKAKSTLITDCSLFSK